MSRREDIDNAIWSDPDFAELTPASKLTYLWSFTNAHCGMAGLYKVSTTRLAFEVGIDVERATSVLAELGERRFLFFQGGVMWVRSRVRHLRTRTPQIARSICNDVAKISEDHPLRVRFLETYSEVEWLREALAEVVAPSVAHVSLRKRHEVYVRDGFKCCKCGSEDDLTVDHIKPKSAAGSAAIENLQTLCRPCNSRKGVNLTEVPRDPSNRPSIRPSESRGSSNLKGNGRGQGYGKGKGSVSELTRANASKDEALATWVQENVPDLDAGLAKVAAFQVKQGGLDLTPELVREVAETLG